MKQIFDLLREQINRSIYSIFLQNNHGVKFKAIDVADVESIINEAEAKWESDCCEWKPRYLHGRTVFQNCFTGYDALNKVDVECFTFCPYCGKPIKISEVE